MELDLVVVQQAWNAVQRLSTVPAEPQRTALVAQGMLALVLNGQAFELGGQLPYQPLVEALRPRLEEENAPEDLLDDLWLAELSRLLPELRVRYPDLPAPILDELTARLRLFEAVARLLGALAR